MLELLRMESFLHKNKAIYVIEMYNLFIIIEYKWHKEYQF
jgi:hypothetical protein